MVELSVDLHGLPLTFYSNHPPLAARFEAIYGHLPPAGANDKAGIRITWRLIEQNSAPLPDSTLPALSEEALVSYYGDNRRVVIRMPKYALLTVDLEKRQVEGQVTPACLNVYGVMEDVLLIALAPLYRRRGWFPLHAFAACPPGGPAALISGAMGSGKTTSGLALLSAGWKLLSNDSPLLQRQESGLVAALAYPGHLSAFDDSLARFGPLCRFIPPAADKTANEPPQKRVFKAEAAFTEPWAEQSLVGGIFFPEVTPGLQQSEVLLVSPAQALLSLLPQAVEGWDKPFIEPHMALLKQVVEQTPCYMLRLSPDVAQLPPLLAGALASR